MNDLADLLDRDCPASHYAVITDSAVGDHYANRVIQQLGMRASVYTFPAGEWNKTRETWATLTDQMLAHEVARDAAVVALGGGVVGDVAGFVAATYHRGLSLVQIPTSLLAMIDSSIGGKTGLDTPHGKNPVGAFHQPSVVIADLDTLSTLPQIQLVAGMAEAIKHGAVQDAGYFDWLVANHERILAKDGDALEETVARSVSIKAAVVREDERERGRRAILNFGHTVAHGIEATTGYEHLHGEAVALGMIAECVLGTRLEVTRPGVTERIRAALEAFGLPTELPEPLDTDRLLDAMGRDKKNRDKSVMFALIREVGEPAAGSDGSWTYSAPENLIRETLKSLQ